MALAQTLSTIDTVSTSLALRAPASDQDISDLSVAILNRTGLIVPDELIQLYRWHNGQGAGRTIRPDENWRFLSIAEVVADWSFYLDPHNEFQRPYRPVWLPLMGNGASDYLMYDLESGALVFYWHDSPGRGRAYPSLADWGQDVLQALSRGAAGGKDNASLLLAHPPKDLVLSIEVRMTAKDLALVRDIHKMSGLPMSLVAKALSVANCDQHLEFGLDKAVNSIDRSARVRSVRKICDLLRAKGHQPNLYARAVGGQDEVANIEALEALELRCLTG